MTTMIDYQEAFEAALSYDEFLAHYGTETHRERWAEAYEHFAPDATHRAILDGFVRDMNLLCLAGAWCGDCVNQCPILEHFARICPKIDLRFVDRDDHADLSAELRICGGNRVPVVVFLSEDFAECGRFGDRTLGKYRQMAAELSGAGCPTRVPGTSSANQVAHELLNEIERIQLMLRVSPRLRARHGD